MTRCVDPDTVESQDPLVKLPLHAPLSFSFCGFLELRESSTLQTHAAEDTSLFLNQVERSVELGNGAFVKNDKAVVVYDGAQAMGN